MKTKGAFTEELRCPKCGELIEEVYFLWSSSQAWEVQRDENGQVISTFSKWTGTMGHDYAFLGCSCELTRDKDGDELDALLFALEKYDC